MTSTATHSSGGRLSIFLVAALVLGVLVGGAFAAGWLFGRIVL